MLGSSARRGDLVTKAGAAKCRSLGRPSGLTRDDSVRDKLDFEWGGVDHAVRNPLLSGNQIVVLERVEYELAPV
jgi:hypothetical protein